MTFLPIVQRELRLAARRSNTYWGRLAVAGAALIIAVCIKVAMWRESQADFGLALFTGLSLLVFIYCLFIGLRTTADCLSEEKREGTLGLLFLTDLKGYDVVLGKLFATSVNAFYAMLAIFPLLAFPLLLGGVTPAEIGRILLVSLNTMLFSLASGMLASALCRDERTAGVIALLIILFFAIGLPLCGFWHMNKVNARMPLPLFFVLSPGYTAFMAFDETAQQFPKFNFFYWALFAVHLLSWGLLLAASFLVVRTWQDKAQSPRQSKQAEVMQNWSFGSPSRRLAYRQRLLAINPYWWIAARDRMRLYWIWLFLAGVGVAWLWGGVFHPRIWLDSSMYLITGIVLHSVLKAWVAGDASQRLGYDCRSGALELILSTPVQVRDILNGQLLALQQQFAVPTLVILIVDIVLLTAGLDDVSGRRASTWLLVWLAGMAMLIVDLFTLPWVAMWAGLTSRYVNRAAGSALWQICAIPWLIFLLYLLALSLLDRFNLPLFSGLERHFVPISISVWVGIGFINNLIFIARAKINLNTRFRAVATDRSGLPLTGWRSWAGEGWFSRKPMLPSLQVPRSTQL